MFLQAINDHWQFVVSILAGLITVLGFLDKVGLKNLVHDLLQLRRYQNDALIALLRNDLEECFRRNREFASWTSEECEVQTKLHCVYIGLGGNGEENIWWEKKKAWAIVSDAEMEKLRIGATDN